MTNSVIDCVILNYNDADTTIEILKKINSFDIFNHIIVVDNSSTDDSYERLKTLSDEKIIVLKNEKNGGYGAGNNLGVFYSYNEFKSNYVVIANPDVLFEEKCIVELIKMMDEDENCILSAPIQLNSNKEIIVDYAWPFPTVWQAILSAGHYLRRTMWKNYGYEWLQQKKNEGLTSVIVDCVPGAMLIVRTRNFCELSGYDENNFLYWEETMIGKKIEKCGGYSRLLLTDTYVHNHSVSVNKSVPKAISRKKLLLEGLYYYLKNYSGANSIQLIIAKCFFKVCILEYSLVTKVKRI